MTTPTDDPPIRCFLSYAQKDDDVLGFVKPFADSLKHFAYSDRGRRLEIFLDRETIGWGELAQTKIRDSVRSALVLLPIITRQYFDRQWCREELLTFHNQAVVDGVPSLLLPVVLLGESHLTDDNPDPAVRIIAERQQRKLKDAWIEGPGSPIWRRTLLGLANELINRVEEAEKTLTKSVEPRKPDPAELVGAAEAFGRETSELVRTAGLVLDEFQWVLSSVDDPREQATALGDSSIQLRDQGRAYEQRAVELDRMLRGDPTGARQLGDLTSDLDEFLDAIEILLAGIRPSEIMNVPLRDVMHQFREGLTAVRSAAVIVSSWAELTDGGQ